MLGWSVRGLVCTERTLVEKETEKENKDRDGQDVKKRNAVTTLRKRIKGLRGKHKKRVGGINDEFTYCTIEVCGCDHEKINRNRV